METSEHALIHGLEESVARTYVGKNADYYVAKWQGIKTLYRGLSWNWWAFFAGFLWLGYRKMYKTALMFIGLFCLADVAFALYGKAPIHNAYNGAFSVMGFLGNHLYLVQAQKAISKAEASFPGDAEAQKAAVAKAGGTSWLGVVLVLLLVCIYSVAASLFFGFLSQSSLERGREQVKANQPAKAIEHLDQAIRYNDEAHKAYILRGMLYSDNGEYEKAIKDMNAAVRLDPKNDGYYYFRGTVYTKKGSTDQAIADHTKAVELNPKNAEALFQRGNIYASGGKLDLAIADYNSAITVDPKAALAYYNLAVAYDMTGKYKEASDAYRKFVALNPALLMKEVEAAKRRLAVLGLTRP
jgi:tetratricopeptide (TPR) repeat protein